MFNRQIVNSIHNSDKLKSDNTLHVVRVISNPARWHSRYRLYREQTEFLKKCPNIKLYTVEMAFGDRCHELEESPGEMHLKVRGKSELWQKEVLINLGVKHLLPANWKYLSWIDADVDFDDVNWGTETLHGLQHYHLLQSWVDGLDLGPQGTVMNHFKSFGYQHAQNFHLDLKNELNGTNEKPAKGMPATSLPDYDCRRYGHTGFQVACTRLFWENAGGLPEYCILGSADHNLMLAAIGKVEYSIHKKMSEDFKDYLRDFQRRILRVTNAEVGYVNNRLYHSFHGSKKNRFYTERWKILTELKFSPNKHLMKDSQGLLHIVNHPKLEQAIRAYNRSRNEDGVDI